MAGEPANTTFQLRPEWVGPCKKSLGTIDVNLGNSPEAFVRAAFCQINGTEPKASSIADWAERLQSTPNLVRRIDVVRTFCNEAARKCSLAYSNPWVNQVEYTGSCVKKTNRDLGVVFMFFSQCPGPTNCAMDWANTHVLGMNSPDELYGFGTNPKGYYRPDNPGFWYRELLDARYAGLQFILPNVYGPDVQPSAGAISALRSALAKLGGGTRVGLFTDTWAWGKPYWGSLMRPVPDLGQVEDSAKRIYQTEWKPFFSGIEKEDWYKIQGQPLIYFYNSGTLRPGPQISAVIEKMKELFFADFGVGPYVVLDHGYTIPHRPEGLFKWYTLDLPRYVSRYTTDAGLKLANFMVKWDSTGRDFPDQIYSPKLSPNRPMIKGPEVLEQVLKDSEDTRIAFIATWNDLGEGTGINRNFDYYYQGKWLPPDYFLKIIRASQCE
jgi:hypothetical protein